MTQPATEPEQGTTSDEPQNVQNATSQDEASPRVRVQADVVLTSGSQVELRDRVIDDLSHGNPDHVVYTRSSLWRYAPEQGTWETLPDAEVIDRVAAYDGAAVGLSGNTLSVGLGTARGVLGFIYAHRRMPDDFFDTSVKGIAFTNGFLTVDEKSGALKLEDHAPKWRARYAYPFPYNDACSPPTQYYALLDRSCSLMSERDREDTKRVLMEFLGACMLGIAPKFERMILLWGESDTGNSTIGKVLAGCIQPGASGTLLPSRFESEFHVATLDGKLLNFCDDLPQDELRNAGQWKTIIASRAMIHADRKHRDPFDFVPIAGHLWACNNPPPVSETGHEFRRRVIVLRFLSQIAEGDKNRDLTSEILAQQKSEIVHRALASVSEAIKRGSLTIPSYSARYVNEWLHGVDPRERFYSEELVELTNTQRSDVTLWTSTNLVYARYRSWCSDNGHSAMSSTKFGTWIKREKFRVTSADAEGAPWKRGGVRYYPVRFARGSTPQQSSDDDEQAATILDGSADFAAVLERLATVSVERLAARLSTETDPRKCQVLREALKRKLG